MCQRSRYINSKYGSDLIIGLMLNLCIFHTLIHSNVKCMLNITISHDVPFLINSPSLGLDNLLVDSYPESEMRLFPDTVYGSLAVKKFKIVSRRKYRKSLQLCDTK